MVYRNCSGKESLFSREESLFALPARRLVGSCACSVLEWRGIRFGMRKKITWILILGMMGLFLWQPHTVQQGARAGLVLWATVIVPTLFPFMLLTGMAQQMNLPAVLGGRLYPLLGRVLPMPAAGCFPWLAGLMSGPPVAAKMLGEACERGEMSRQEGQRLLILCNNVSPMFLLEYMAGYCLDMSHPVILLVTGYIAAYLCCWGKYFLQGRNKERHTARAVGADRLLRGETLQTGAVMGRLDRCIQDSVQVLIKVGAYMVIFSVFASLLQKLPVCEDARALLAGTCEITIGGNAVRTWERGVPVRQIWTAFLCGFGGMSSAMQSIAVLGRSGLSGGEYLRDKLCQGIAAAGLLFLTQIVLRITI